MPPARPSAAANTLWYLLPTLVTSAVPLATFPIVTRVLTLEDYGAWGLAVAYGVVATGIANLGLTVGYERNFFQHNTDADRGRLLYSVLACVTLVLVVVGAGTWLARGAIARLVVGHETFGTLVVVAFAANAVTSLKAYYLLYLKNTRQARLHTLYSVDETVLGALAAVGLVVWAGWGPLGLVAGQLGAAVVVLGLVIIRLAREVRPGWSWPMLSDALAISLPLTPRIFLGVLGNHFDKYLIGLLGTLGGVGLYTAGQRLAYVVFQFLTALGNVFTPTVYERLMSGVPAVQRSVGVYLAPFAWLTAGFALAVSLFADEALWLLTSGDFRQAGPIVSLLALSYGVLFFGKVPQLTAARKTWLTSVVTMVSLALNVGINLYTVPRWGAIGAAGGTLTATVLSTALAVVLGQRVCPIDWPWTRLALVFGAMSSGALVGGLAGDFGVRLGVAVAFVVVGAALGYLAWPMGIVQGYLRRRERRRVRRMMRGFRRLRAEGRLDEIVESKDRLARTPVVDQGHLSRFVFGAAHPSAGRVLQQYLAVHVLHERLQRALLASAGSGTPLVCPLPRRWQRALAAAGIRVDGTRSTLLWAGLVIAWLGRGILRTMGIARIVVLGPPGATVRRARWGGAGHLTNTAAFDGLGPTHLPNPGADGRSFDIFSWYAQWDGRRPGVDRLVHTIPAPLTTTAGAGSLPVVHRPDLLPQLSRTAACRTLAWCAAAIVRATIDLLRGRWAHAAILSQAIQARQLAEAPGSPAGDYLFHNSGWLYRPLWTYEAEARGSRVLFYFYSTNIETFKGASGYRRQAHMWHVATWPAYLVWDEAQAAFIRREVAPDAVVQVVGPIPFGGRDDALPDVQPDAVAVFDVQPHRDFTYQVIVAQPIYYTPEVALAFINDIQAALADVARPMVFKHKRQVDGHAIHARYRRRLAALHEQTGIVALDPTIAAWRVIEASSAVISMPFTSTALLGRAQGKPSIYYVPEYAPFDPVQDDDRAAHGIPIVRGPVALRAWLGALPTGGMS